MLQVSNISSTQETDQKVLGQLSDLYDRELVGIIGKYQSRIFLHRIYTLVIIYSLSDYIFFLTFDRCLFYFAGWAKQIPGFSSLALNDQMRLLQSTWAEILTFTLAWRSTPNSGRLRFAQDFALDERIARDCHCMELYTHVCNFCDRFYSYFFNY